MKKIIYLALLGVLMAQTTLASIPQDFNGFAPPEIFFYVFGTMFIVLLFVVIALLIYFSLAFMAISKRAGLANPGLAWVPGTGPTIIAYQCSGMHWWPWLLIYGFYIPFLNFIFVITFLVFTIIWYWKMFEKIGRPGWWAILMIIPIVNLIIVGIAAWGSTQTKTEIPQTNQ